MRVLVTGGSGFVGYRMCEALVSKGHEVDYTYQSNPCAIEGAAGYPVDVSSREALFSLAGRHYDAVVHAAALANVDLCEKDPEAARRQNVDATKNALDFSILGGAKLAYVSTSHVFPQSKRAYTEEDAPSLERAPNVYGRTKLEGELLVAASPSPHLILRIDQPYYWNMPWQKENTVTRTIRKLAEGSKAMEVADWFNCPTFVPSFCELSLRLLAMEKASGIFHAAGPEYISRFDWGKLVAREFGFGEENVLPVSSKTFNLQAARPNVRLDSRKAYKLAGIGNAGQKAGLGQMAREWKAGAGKKWRDC